MTMHLYVFFTLLYKNVNLELRERCARRREQEMLCNLLIVFQEVWRMEVNCMEYEGIRKAYHVAQRLICLKHSTQDEDSIRQALLDLKETYIDGRL